MQGEYKCLYVQEFSIVTFLFIDITNNDLLPSLHGNRQAQYLEFC